MAWLAHRLTLDTALLGAAEIFLQVLRTLITDRPT
jgi:hypothetical protein